MTIYTGFGESVRLNDQNSSVTAVNQALPNSTDASVHRSSGLTQQSADRCRAIFDKEIRDLAVTGTEPAEKPADVDSVFDCDHDTYRTGHFVREFGQACR